MGQGFNCPPGSTRTTIDVHARNPDGTATITVCVVAVVP